MSRSFSIHEFVQLPRLTTTEANVLAQELLTVAKAQEKLLKEKKLPSPIERSRKRLMATHDALSEALRPMTIETDSSSQAKRQADQVLDNAWGALYEWLSGWCRLPEGENPNAAKANELFTLLFSEGLGFIRYTYKSEWQQTQTRLEAIARDQHEDTFKALGGSAFLQHLKAAHKVYGEVLGITVEKTLSKPVELREKWQNVLVALRDYVARVSAYADPEEAGSEELSQGLLRPLTEWQTSRPTKPSPSESSLKPTPLSA